jgi:Mg2+ and Co2+ transporter CorA
MKRLTWVTFIFLPLTFVAGLFGMNINLFEANPAWWWYLVFAFGTLSLTLFIWIIFKRFPDVRYSIFSLFVCHIGLSS